MTAIPRATVGFEGVAQSEPLNTVIDVLNGLTGQGGSAQPATVTTLNVSTSENLSGTLTVKPTPIVSAGSTQLGATPITTRKVVVTTATASSKGVLLPVASTGLEVKIINNGPTFGTKVYPNSHGTINAGASNAADTTVLAAYKTTIYQALDTLHWVTMRG